MIVLDDSPAASASEAFGERSALFATFESIDLAADGTPGKLDRDLIVFDQRGTGRSGPIRCPGLERLSLRLAGREAATCARLLGRARSLYGTPDSTADIEAIRRALGVRRIALFGVAGGARLATAYALEHPERVERMVLDSPVEIERPDPLGRDTFRATHRVLRSLCRGRCRGITDDPIADIAQLVDQLAAAPVRGVTVGRSGRPRAAALFSSSGLVRILRASEYDPFLRSAFPAAVRSALEGDTAALLRLRRRTLQYERLSALRPANVGAYAAQHCEETLFPWSGSTPIASRPALARTRLGRLPIGTWGPFDVLTALGSDQLGLCARWPVAGAPAIPAGPLRGVPVLVLVGADDLQTPVGTARRVAARFDRGQVLAVPAVGHHVLADLSSECATRAFTRFLAGRSVRRRCPPTARDFPPAPRDPLALTELPAAFGIPGSRGRAASAALATVEDTALDVISSFLADPESGAENGPPPRGGGLRGGRWALVGNGVLRLRRVVYVPGVRISGIVDEFFEGDLSARLRISGPAVPDGRLRITGDRVKGRLGGRRIRGRLRSLGAVARSSQRRCVTAPRCRPK